MKMLMASLCAALIFAPSIMACDVCGSLSGNQWGILPQFKRSFVGLRTSQQSFKTQHSLLYPENHSREYLFSLDASLRYYLSPRWQFFATLPLQHNRQDYDFEQRYTRIWGLGDASVNANFVLFNNTQDSVNHRFKQIFSITGGIKLPTGKADRLNAAGTLLNPNLQTGTGSWDLLFSAIYTVRHRAFGLHTEANYRLNGSNRADFKFGDRFNASSRIFYWLQRPRFAMLFQAGAIYEQAQADIDHKYIVSGSGQQNVSALVGVDLYYQRFVVGISAQPPMWQQSNGGMLTRQTRFQMQVNYMF
jgi:hypothetical protein